MGHANSRHPGAGDTGHPRARLGRAPWRMVSMQQVLLFSQSARSLGTGPALVAGGHTLHPCHLSGAELVPSKFMRCSPNPAPGVWRRACKEAQDSGLGTDTLGLAGQPPGLSADNFSGFSCTVCEPLCPPGPLVPPAPALTPDPGVLPWTRRTSWPTGPNPPCLPVLTALGVLSGTSSFFKRKQKRRAARRDEDECWRWASGWAQVGLEEKGPVQDAHLSRVTSRRRRLGPSPHGSFPRLREEPAGAISTVGVGGSLGTVSRAWVQRFELSQTPGPAWGHSARRCLTALSSDGRRFWRRGRAGLPPR
ncbi:unnamed protein product [Rangifer tarandus platyrhynchus]|uniref:Uncharacterized protein n=1 Tax=Rangifer tarandus platyrhynchus TaxID=3082113 RepID=A0AC59ZFD4_RANTA